MSGADCSSLVMKCLSTHAPLTTMMIENRCMRKTIVPTFPAKKILATMR